MDFDVSSNLRFVVKDIEADMQRLADKVGRLLAFSALGLLQDRIFIEGRLPSGELIGDGAYSAMYTKLRRAKGRQVNVVDLTYTGQLAADFTVLPEGDSLYKLGVQNMFNAEKIEKLERQYGAIFELSEYEIDFLLEALERELKKNG